MRRARVFCKLLVFLIVLDLLVCRMTGLAADPPAPPAGNAGGDIQQVRQPEEPVAPPRQPLTEPAAPTGAAAPPPATSPFGNLPGPAPAQVSPERQATSSAPGTDYVGGGPVTQGLATTDVGNLLNKSPSALGVETQKRSPIANETRVRGYNLGQTITQADGAFWFPARQDLDTFLSKIDSGLVEDIVVLKGPYSARYGPAFAFIDIETYGSPRYQCGFEIHGRTAFDYKDNGRQLYGRQSVWGGSSDYGFRFSYGQRTGNDYTTGAGIQMPSSYNSRDIDFVYGVDPTADSHIEFGYLRLDQTNLEFPGQVFDTRFLTTNGFRGRYILENQGYFDRLMVDGWFNYTVAEGDAQRPSKRVQIPVLASSRFNGFTNMDLASSGVRAAMTWGQQNEPQITLGSDFRYLYGHLNEFDTFFGLNVPCGNTINFPVPRSHQSTVGGLFAEYALPLQEWLTIKMGARGDWVNMDIDAIPPGFTCDSFQRRAADDLLTTEFERDFGLWLAYLTGEYKLDNNWTALVGLGHGERAPTTTEMYAMGPYLAILQQGFTTILGNPQLAHEKLWQFDVGLRTEYETYRGGISGFCSLIQDFITYAALEPAKQLGLSPLSVEDLNALSVRFVNTDLAVLAGFELYGEFDYTEYVTPFLTIGYVAGRDLDRKGRGNEIFGRSGQPLPGVGKLGSNQEPLPGIAPLDTRAGVRFHAAGRNPGWGLELAGRFVAPQERVASSLLEQRSSGFAVYDVRSFWRARDNVTLTAGVENVFNRFYQEHLDLRTGRGVYQPGLNGYVGVELRY